MFALRKIDRHAIYPFEALSSEWKESDDVTAHPDDEHVTLLYNDEVHTFDDVIDQLVKAVPGLSRETALEFANRIDKLPGGVAVVRVGTRAEW